MWVRQCKLDAGAVTPPIPARIASNEEFIPPPQSPQQREYEARLAQIAERAERRQAIRADKLSQLREQYRHQPAPSNTQYGWLWVEDGTDPTTPVGG
ncbi:MAG: hypothetical protein WD403_09370 [Pirellulales bacterium]